MSDKSKVLPDEVEIKVGDAVKDILTGDFAGAAGAVKMDVSLPIGRAMGGIARAWRRVSGGEHPAVLEADASLARAKEKMAELFLAAQPVLLEMRRQGTASVVTEKALTVMTDGNERGEFKFGRIGRNEYREMFFATNAEALSNAAGGMRADPVWAAKLRSVESSATGTLEAIQKAKDDEFRVVNLGLTSRLNRTSQRADANSEEVLGVERSFKLVANLVPSSEVAEPTMGEGEVAQFRRVTAYTSALNVHLKKLMAPQMALENTASKLGDQVAGWARAREEGKPGVSPMKPR